MDQVTTSDSQRPQLSPELTGGELLRWYWLKDELTGFARTLGVRATGSKELLTQRLAAALDGQPFTEPAAKRAAGSKQLSGTLSASTVIPKGQRCSQIVRAWFIDQVVSSFGFDSQMREFFANTDGIQTLQDALNHYLDTREQGQKSIDSQFEYNRFTRDWHAEHPESSREELVEAWHDYRNRPIDERGRI